MRMPTAMKPQLASGGVPGTAMKRLGTASQNAGARPMTAVRGAGYSSNKSMVGASNDATSGVASNVQLEVKVETEEDKIKQLEKKVCQLAEESCFAVEENDKKAAIEKAKEAYKKERLLFKQREEKGLGDHNNIELTGFVS